MQAISKTVSIGFLFLLLINLIHVGCKKDENEPYIQPDLPPVLHKEWHESMSGKILFTAMLEGSNREYIFVIDKDETKQIPHPEYISSIDGGVEWSPDGTKIAFANWNDGLFVMENDGSNPINLYDEHDCHSPTWSSNGSVIACVDWIKNIRMVDHESGISSFFEIGYGLQSIDWAPTSIHIVFFKDLLQLFNVADSSIVDVYVGQAYYPVWSPDGQKIAFIKNGWYKDEYIYTINTDGSDITQVLNFHDQDLIVHCGDLCWSPDGNMLAAGAHDGIYVVDLSGNIITKISVKECHSIDWR